MKFTFMRSWAVFGVFAGFGRVWGAANVEIRYGDETIYGSISTSTVSVESAYGFGGEDLVLLYPVEESLRDGCGNSSDQIGDTPPGRFAILFDRGNCNLEDKMLTAEEVGAELLIVSNMESVIFNETSGRLLDACRVDCGEAHSSTQESCQAKSGCDSNYCLPAFLEEDEDTEAYCCVIDNLINMGSTIDFDSLSGVFIEVLDGENLVASMTQDVLPDFTSITINIRERDDYLIDPGVYVLLFTGTLVTAYASYRSAQPERLLLQWVWGTKSPLINFERVVHAYAGIDIVSPPSQESASEEDVSNEAEKEEDKRTPIPQPNVKTAEELLEETKKRVLKDTALESLELTLSQGMMMIVFASISLVGMFLLVQNYSTEVVIGLIFMFGLGAIYATSYFVLRPILRFILPPKLAYIQFNEEKKYGMENFTLEGMIGVVLAGSLVVVWWVFRHEKDKVWMLQNLFSFSVACMFLSTLRVNTLQTCVYVLAGFFIYDIFMVFITPFFGGESVMLEVATAGAGDTEVTTVDDLHCSRTEDEQIPVLFISPRFGYEEGYSLLGLGDILLPGIFVSYVLRVDYIRARLAAIMAVTRFINEKDVSQLSKKEIEEHFVKSFTPKGWLHSHMYWLSVVFAYFVGLAVTFVANMQGWTINGVEGQPALLYLVPATIGTFTSMAKYRGELGTLWTTSLTDFSESYLRKVVRDELEAEDTQKTGAKETL